MTEDMQKPEEGYGAVVSAFIVLTMLILGFAWVASREFAERAQFENESRESIRSTYSSGGDVAPATPQLKEVYRKFVE